MNHTIDIEISAFVPSGFISISIRVEFERDDCR